MRFAGEPVFSRLVSPDCWILVSSKPCGFASVKCLSVRLTYIAQSSAGGMPPVTELICAGCLEPHPDAEWDPHLCPSCSGNPMVLYVASGGGSEPLSPNELRKARGLRMASLCAFESAAADAILLAVVKHRLEVVQSEEAAAWDAFLAHPTKSTPHVPESDARRTRHSVGRHGWMARQGYRGHLRYQCQNCQQRHDDCRTRWCAECRHAPEPPPPRGRLR